MDIKVIQLLHLLSLFAFHWLLRLFMHYIFLGCTTLYGYYAVPPLTLVRILRLFLGSRAI